MAQGRTGENISQQTSSTPFELFASIPAGAQHAGKAEKNGLESVIGHLEVLDAFYEVFARNMRDLGTPVYSQSFFGNILEAFPDTTHIFAVYHETRMIAAGIGSWFKDTFEVTWASSISDYNALCPNNMLYWEAILFAIRNGFKKFDFGRSTPHEGTYNFKKQWGAQSVQPYWQYLMDGRNVIRDLSPSNPRYHAARYELQRLPLPATRVLGPMIVRNIPQDIGTFKNNMIFRMHGMTQTTHGHEVCNNRGVFALSKKGNRQTAVRPVD